MIYIFVFAILAVNLKENGPSQTPYPISVSIRQMETDFDVDEEIKNNNCAETICNNDNRPKCGVNCWGLGVNKQSMKYSFRGEKFGIYGTYNNEHGKFEIDLDGKYFDSVCLKQNLAEKVYVYESSLLIYGDHTITIRGIGDKMDFYKLVYWPSIKAKRINSSELSPPWDTRYDNIGGSYQATDGFNKGKEKTFTFSKLWVYGPSDFNGEEVFTQIDNGAYNYALTVSEKERYGNLLYESDSLPLKEHYFLFARSPSQQGYYYLECIYYLDEEIPVTSTPISVSLKEMKTNININNDCTNTPCSDTTADSNCGVVCSNIGEGQYLEYTFHGEKFRLIGKKSPSISKFNIYRVNQKSLGSR